jgi:hypothetical protein
LISKRILANSDFGSKIFETVVGNNHTLYDEFVEKFNSQMAEEPAGKFLYDKI